MSATRKKTAARSAPKKRQTKTAPKSDAPKPAPKAPKAATPKPDPKPKRVSVLDAAAQVLTGATKPMRCKEILAEIEAKGLWSSPGGKTPASTLYAAIIREIEKKGEKSRFTKIDRGLFSANKEAAS
ncbi:MAG: winged helix-turn-helix domain-containing protein [Planctomycetota bacterium]|nr:winged helix-turn-helix domain-containing protein [Planctomycetota bacterium]